MMEVLKKTATLEYEKQMAENAIGDIQKKVSNPKQSAMEVIKSTLDAIAEQIAMQGPMIQDSNRGIQPAPVAIPGVLLYTYMRGER